MVPSEPVESSVAVPEPEDAASPAAGDGDGAEAERGRSRSTEGGAAGRERQLEEILTIVRHIHSAVEEGGKDGKMPSNAGLDELAATVEALVQSGGEVRSLLQRLVGEDPDYQAAIEAAAGLAEGMKTQRADLGRLVEGERGIRRHWASLAIAAGFPAFLLLGVLVEQQFQIVPLHDPTGGWRGHVWEEYGQRIVDCAVEAKGTSGGVKCSLVVRWPQRG